MSQLIQNAIAILIVLTCLGWVTFWIRNWLRGVNTGDGCASSGCGSCPSNTAKSETLPQQDVVSMEEIMRHQ